MSVQGPAAWGQLTVWESGEVAVEAMSVETGELVLSEQLAVASDYELLAIIRRLVAACEV